MHVRRGWVCLAVVACVGYAGLGHAEMSTEERLRALESALRKAQGEIERLRGEIQQQKAISQGAQTQIEEARKVTEDQGKKIEEAKKSAVPDWAKKVSLFGDVRMRHEGFYHQPADKGGSAVTARNRERIRARIGAKATFSDELSATIRLATQSGPMLVIDGRIHPAFSPDGSSRYVRNGVGIVPDGRPRFVISDDSVSLGKFARFFRDQLKCNDALFFDGAVSALWDPAAGRRDVTKPLGPIIVVFKPSAGSAPRP